MAIADTLAGLDEQILVALVPEKIVEAGMEVPDGNGPPVNSIICREMRIDVDGSELDFRYQQMESSPIPIGDRDAVLRYIRHRQKIPQGKTPPHDYGNRPTGFPQTTSLSIKVAEPVLLVLFIRSPLNIYFSRRGTPFSYDKQNNPDRLFDATRVGPDGSTHLAVPQGSLETVEACRIATMIVNPPNGGSPPQDFHTAFNIHLGVDLTRGQTEFHIPIIIDPDVRYPGGSG